MNPSLKKGIVITLAIGALLFFFREEPQQEKFGAISQTYLTTVADTTEEIKSGVINIK